MRRYFFSVDARDFEEVISPSGDKVRKKYQLDISPNGQEKLIEVGEENIQDVIQAHVGACDLKQILKRHEMMGTLSELQSRSGSDVNLVDLPKNLHEVKAALEKADVLFQNLKPEIKAQFENVEAFLAAFGSVSGLKAFADHNAALDLAPDSAPDPAPAPGGGDKV